MDKSKYGKYIITQPKPDVPPKEWGSGDIGSDRVSRLVYLDEEYPKGPSIWNAYGCGKNL